VGRTGTILAIEDGARTLNKGREVDIAKIVTHIRAQRPKAVQTRGQYLFIYAVILHFANVSLSYLIPILILMPHAL